MSPKASLVHQTPKRVRVKITSKRGDKGYFSSVIDGLTPCKGCGRLETNPLTGSIVFACNQEDFNYVVQYAQDKGLFELSSPERHHISLPKKVAAPFGGISDFLHNLTSGEIDLAGVAFLTLLGMGIYQLIQGNSRVPPWYTAFWYAFGVFSKSIQNTRGGSSIVA